MTGCRSGGSEDWDEARLLRSFWRFFKDGDLRVVTWNGRHFDMPTLAMRSMLYGIPAAAWYRRGARWAGYTHGYALDWHTDLMDAMTDFGAPARLTLEEASTMLGRPPEAVGSRVSAAVGLRLDDDTAHALDEEAGVDQLGRDGGGGAGEVERRYREAAAAFKARRAAAEADPVARQVMDQLVLRRAMRLRDDLDVERQTSARERAVLGDTQADVLGAGDRQESVLDRLLAGAMAAVPAADGAVLELVDGNTLEYRAVRGSLAPHRGLRVPLDGSSSGRCYRTNAPVVVGDARADARISQALAASIDLGSSIHVPVTRGEAVLGVLKLQSRARDAFTQRDVDLARVLAGTATSGLTQVSEAQARRAVRAGEARYQAVFESIVDYAIVVMDLDGNVTDWNAGAERTLGWTAEEMRGRPADVFFTPEDREADIADWEMLQAREHGRGADERWHVRKGGARFFASGEMMPLLDGDGQHAGFVKVLRDRTGQRLAEERLRQSDERLQMALSASGDVGLWDWMVDTDLLHGDAHFARMYALDPDRTAAGITMEQYQEHVVAEDVAPLRAAIRATFDGGAPFHVEYRLDIPGQGRRWVECKGRLIHDEAGAAVRFSGTAVDVTARKATEAALRERERELGLERGLFEAIFRQAPVGISVAGATPDVPSFLNDRAEAMLGHGIGEGGDARFRGYGAEHPDGTPYAPEEYPTLRALRGGETVRAEDMRYRNARTGAIRLLEVSSSPVRDADGTVRAAATVLADVTERRETERLARRLALIVEQSDDFIGVADAEGRVEYVNTAGRAMVGFADEAAARAARVPEFFFPEDLPHVEAEIVPCILAGGSWVGDYRFRNFATGAPVPVHYNQFSLRGPDGAFEGYATVSRDIAERKRAEVLQDLLNYELSHRMKNLLAMVQAIAASTLRGATDVAQARDILGSRLVALGKAHDVLLGGAAERALLSTVVREGVGVQEEAGRRVSYTGPDVEIGGKAALSLALTLHELTTNAVKYGALSAPEGKVAVTAAVDGDVLQIAWRENGGPPVRPPERKGFGSRLIERGLSAQVGASVRIDYPPEGVTCIIEATVANFQAAV